MLAQKTCVQDRGHPVMGRIIPFCAVSGFSRLGVSWAVAAGIALVLALVLPAAAAAEDNSCVACHNNSGLRVTNKKLYDYYREWRGSIHADEGVGCHECHGGDPAKQSKKGAHGPSGLSTDLHTSPVNYRNVSRTCSKCHEAFYRQFQKSQHFEHLRVGKDKAQGPSCVTCHASVSTRVLNVNTVRSTCEHCHNEQTGNEPDIPDRAAYLLGKFLSISRYYRFLTIRGDLLNDRKTLEAIDRQTNALFAVWHTFDLDAVEDKTQTLLTLLKRKRDEIRKRLRRP